MLLFLLLRTPVSTGSGEWESEASSMSLLLLLLAMRLLGGPGVLVVSVGMPAKV